MGSRKRVLALLAMLAVAPAGARAAMPVGIYPFRVPGLSAAQRADLQALLEAGLISAARRGVLHPRSPVGLPTSCGDTPSDICLATISRDGLVLAGRGEIRGNVILIAAALWDRNGAHTREVRFVVDLVIQNLRPLNEALAELEIEIEPDGTIAGSAKTPPPARDPRAPAAAAGAPALGLAISGATAPPPGAPGGAARAAPQPPPPSPSTAAPIAALHREQVIAPVTPPPPAAAPKPPPAPATQKQLAAIPLPPPPKLPPAIKATPVDVSAPPKAPAVWKRQAGPLFTFVGAGLVVAGGAVALSNRALAHDLDQKYANGELTPSDAASYDRVKQNNTVSAVLLGAGAVTLGAGTYLWITAPPAGAKGSVAMVGAGGSF